MAKSSLLPLDEIDPITHHLNHHLQKEPVHRCLSIRTTCKKLAINCNGLMNPTMKTLLSPLLLLIQESRQRVQSSPGILRQPGRPRRGLPVMVVQVGRKILCINRESASPVLTIAYRVTPTPCISASIQRYIHRRENRHRVTVTNRSLHRSY